MSAGEKNIELSFWLEMRAGCWVLVYRDGGCTPASRAEEQLWLELQRMQRLVPDKATVCQGD